MKIKAISLKNFRNYRKIDINFNSNINLFLGKNGQGKTNLLEAIWICINGKSYRTNTTKNLINFSKNNAEIITRFSNQDSNNEIRISIKDNKKEIFLNDKKIQPRIQAFSEHLVLTFLCLLIVIPVFWIIDTSFSPGNSLSSSEGFRVRDWTTEHFSNILSSDEFYIWVKNSLIVSIGAIGIAKKAE
mgnify:CR=1 FL=1